MKSHLSHLGVAGRVAFAFVDSPLTSLIVATTILLGIMAVWLLPREEEPQIKVPMIDVMVSMPGASAKEIEERVTRPMEKLLWEIAGVEYLYSTSRPGQSLVIVRFEVGRNIEESLVKLNQKLQSNFDRIPHGVSFPLIKPKSIDDVPILALTFHSKRYDHLMLRRLVAQIDEAVKQVPQVAETAIIGGARRQVRVLLDHERLAARNLSALDIAPLLQQANKQFASGSVVTQNQSLLIETGGFLTNAEDVANVVVGVYGGRPIYLREVADVKDDAEELNQYVLFGYGAAKEGMQAEQPAVTLTVAKRPGANAVDIADLILTKLDQLRPRYIPSDVQITVSRNYGETALEKSNELLFHMLLAVLGVSLLILLVLGWRESIVVAIAIPATLGLTLLVFYLYGYTLNRITLFALIFSIGILVDDAIVVIENVVRQARLPENQGRSFSEVAVEAVSEVGNPTILATFAVIAAILPMAFVGGLMGPYMRPIPIGSTAAMLFSLAIAFIVTPWAAVRVIGRHEAKHEHSAEEDWFTRIYRDVMGPLIRHSGWRMSFITAVTVLLLLSLSMVGIGWVKVKMLPFDNKSEFQIVLNMPEGSSLEKTTEAAREIATAVREEPEVMNYQIYAGTAAPFTFNGLVRHYYMRQGPSMADVQVNLLSKDKRSAQSHEIAKRVRPRVADIAARYKARVAIAEVPPGPPVLQTIVAEIYGPSEESRLTLAGKVRNILRQTEGVVDIDSYIENDEPKVRFLIDKEKAALNGVSAETISETLRLAVGAASLDLVHTPTEPEDINVVLELPRSARTSPEELLSLRVHSMNPAAKTEAGRSALVPLGELVRMERSVAEKSIYHKNLMPVSYVVADVAGAIESPVYAILKMNRELEKLNTAELGGDGSSLPIFNAKIPFTDLNPALKWDGEWHITIEVFRDLGLAFIVVLILIYVLMVGWFSSYLTPLIVMAAIPFSLIGILPAHGAMGAFFSATSMIGFMAGAGIVVRNSIILVDFIEQRIKEGLPLDEAVIDAGAVRFRPMMLTAMAVVVGAGVILFDPIFQGLAISLMAGEVASLLISRMAVPLFYFMAHANTIKILNKISSD